MERTDLIRLAAAGELPDDTVLWCLVHFSLLISDPDDESGWTVQKSALRDRGMSLCVAELTARNQVFNGRPDHSIRRFTVADLKHALDGDETALTVQFVARADAPCPENGAHVEADPRLSGTQAATLRRLSTWEFLNPAGVEKAGQRHRPT